MQCCCGAGDDGRAVPQVDAEDEMGNTPLHLAAAAGSAAVVQALINAQANLGARNLHGSTPLHLAFAHNDRRCATVIFSSGLADVNEADEYGRTALHIAFSSRVAALQRAKDLGVRMPRTPHVGRRPPRDKPGNRGESSDRPRVAEEFPAGSADDFAQGMVLRLRSVKDVGQYIEDIDEVRVTAALAPARPHSPRSGVVSTAHRTGAGQGRAPASHRQRSSTCVSRSRPDALVPHLHPRPADGRLTSSLVCAAPRYAKVHKHLSEILAQGQADACVPVSSSPLANVDGIGIGDLDGPAAWCQVQARHVQRRPHAARD